MPHRRDDGSAPVEFVLVGTLVVALFLGVLQLGLLLHMRNVAVASASEAARTAANADRDCADGVRRFEQLLGSGLSDRVVRGVRERRCGIDPALAMAHFEADIDLPLVFLPFGSVSISVVGRAFEEGT